jgi:bifunctional non-homologous end joining protein LigD
VREDKPAREVVRETPIAFDTDRSAPHNAGRTSTRLAAETARTMAKKSKPVATKASASADRRRPAASRPKPRKQDGARLIKVKPTEVKFTHPDRVYWADVGLTKQDLADYYRMVWDTMAPHVVGRPLALLRCPDGTEGQCFFQKHASAGLAEDDLRSVIDSKGRQVIAIDDLDGLLALVQAGVLELHVRGSTIDRLDLCERIVFDLDPGEGVGWVDIVAAAREVRERLEAIDLQSFVKLSGGKGLHVVVPVAPVDWETTKTFVQVFAQAMAADEPKRYLAKMTKSLRSGRIFVDYLRNSLEQTSVAAYSTRARAGAPVSAPVTWQELPRTTGGHQYTALNLGKRLRALKRDPWADIGRIKQRLPDLRTPRK